MSTDELHLRLQVKNNRLYSRRMALGLTQDEIAKEIGISTAHYQVYENMTEKPFEKKSGIIKDVVQKILIYFNCTFEELFPNIVLSVEKRALETTLNEERAERLLEFHNLNTPLLPSEIYDRKELRERIDEALLTLTPREREIIRETFLSDDPKTLADLAKKHDRSNNCMSLVQKKALRKLRHPSRTKLLGDYADEAKLDAIDE